MGNGFWDDEPRKRTLSIRDRQILWERAGHKCENPFCKKKLTFPEMQVGHKQAASRGGRATLRNCVCLCYKCNKLQGTDSWKTFLRKQQKPGVLKDKKKILKTLNLRQLKFLAKKHHIKVKGRLVDDLWETYKKPPTKTQYVNALAKVVSEKNIESKLKKMPKVKKRKKKRSSDRW